MVLMRKFKKSAIIVRFVLIKLFYKLLKKVDIYTLIFASQTLFYYRIKKLYL